MHAVIYHSNDKLSFEYGLVSVCSDEDHHTYHWKDSLV